jgi:predicted aspartyl protease
VSESYKTARDSFDRILGHLTGMPDVTKTGATTIREAAPVTGDGQTFVVQTFRQKEKGDFILLEYLDAGGAQRIVIPPKVTATIARQRDALTARVRRDNAKQAAADRKARGEVPAFLNGKAKGKKKRSRVRVVPAAVGRLPAAGVLPHEVLEGREDPGA